MKFIIKFILVVLLIGAGFSNYKLFRSSEFQSNIMYDYNNASYILPIEFIKSQNGEFPNVTITTLPIKFLQARYYEQIDSLEQAKKLYHESMSDRINPYLNAAEAEIADLYYNIKEYDSAYFYAKKAFYQLPNSNVHRTIYFKTLKQRKDTVELEKAFNRIKRFNNPSHWVNYFYERFELVGPGDNQILTLIEEYRKKFNLQKDVGTDVLEKFMLQGGNKVIKSVEASLEATRLFGEKKYLEAAELFVIASQIEETEYTFYENAGIAYNLAENYEKASYFFDKVIYEFNPGIGKAEFYKGVMLVKIGSQIEGCKYIKKALELNYSGTGSQQVFMNLCN